MNTFAPIFSMKWLTVLCAMFAVLFSVPNYAVAESEFLKPSEAFKVRVDESLREVHWTIADGYYLYRSKVKVSVSDGQGGYQSVPFEFLTDSEQKDDPNFGLVDVFHHQMAIKVGAVEAGNEKLKLVYQGCAEAGLCYPPKTQWLSWASTESLPSESANNDLETTAPLAELKNDTVQKNSTNQSSASSVSGEESRLVNLLLNGDRIWVLLTFFALGLGLTFTPCVLPMIPILAGIIAGQAGNITSKKGFFLSLAYVLGMSFSYSLAGVMVGLFGAQFNLQALLQAPSVLIFFSLIFVLLSLSMFGFYELQLPMFLRDRLDKLSQKSVGGPYLGVAIMGAVSALVVSPCVSAPLAGALIYISTTGDAVLGGSVLLVMSLGMGVPLLLVGLGGGRFLPKAGNWMMQVKAAFGVVLLGVAILLVSRMVSELISVLLWSLLIVMYAVHLAPFKSSESGWSKTRQGIAIILLAYGVSLLSSVLASAPSLESPLSFLKGGSSAASDVSRTPLFQRHADVAKLEALMDQSSAAGIPVIIDTYADWCTACIEMEKYVFSRPELSDYREKVAFLQLDITDNSEDQQAFLSRYGLFGPPALLFFSQSGELKSIRQGEITFEEFLLATRSLAVNER